MKEPDLNLIKAQLIQGLCNDSDQEIFDAIFEFEMYCLIDKSIPDEVFVFLEEVLDSYQAHQSKYSHHIFGFFDAEWEKLRGHQKKSILRLICKNYHRYKDWVACFIMSEILGECFSNRQSLSVVRKLKRTCKIERPRSIIPHAFEHHVTDSNCPLVRRLALRELESMSNDPVKKVRLEAKVSLERIKSRYKSRFSDMPFVPRKAP